MALMRKNFDKIVASFTKPIADLEQYMKEQSALADAANIKMQAAEQARDKALQEGAAAMQEVERADRFKQKLETFLNY